MTNFYNLFRAERSKIENNGSSSVVRESEFKWFVTLAMARRYLKRFEAQQSVGVSCPLISKIYGFSTSENSTPCLLAYLQVLLKMWH